jgi:hypothetical protein
MTLTRLIPLYKKIKQNNETYAFFDFKKNGVTFHIFLDIETKPNYLLGFMVPGTQFNLWIDVTEDFKIDTYINEKYGELMEVLNLKSDPENKFSTNAFFSEFNEKIPSDYMKAPKNVLNDIAIKKYDVEENESLYYLSFRRLPPGWHRTEKNSEKTRLLLPKIYERIKDRDNISINYTPFPNIREDDDRLK